MSFQEDCARFGDQLVRLVDCGVLVKEAAVVVGVSRQRCYAILRAIGRPVGRPRGPGRPVDAERIVAVFARTGSINKASIECEVAFSVARRVLVDAGVVTADKLKEVGKPEARTRFLALIEPGWSSARAAREVGVNERTARDWRKGIRRTSGRRIYPDGMVVDYRTGSVYKQPVTRLSWTESMLQPPRSVTATSRSMTGSRSPTRWW
ncbi:hypothetical protein EV191_1031, partial [Tamaricihabitans halophyticus]